MINKDKIATTATTNKIFIIITNIIIETEDINTDVVTIEFLFLQNIYVFLIKEGEIKL